MKELLRVMKALSDINRLRILKLLQSKKMCVCELAEIIKITQPSVSKHLRILKEADLVKDEKAGYWINYFLNNKNDNEYQKELMELIKIWLNNDDIIINDINHSLNIPYREYISKKESVA